MTDATATVVLRHPDEASARTVHDALRPDDDAFCRTRLEGADVVAELRADSPRSLLRAVDDLLACAAVAEDVIKRA